MDIVVMEKREDKKFESCCSIDCLFIGFCKDYNNSINRAEGCKTQKRIIEQVERYKDWKLDEKNRIKTT